MIEIFANGHGGKHRDTDGARKWRTATASVARTLGRRYPHADRSALLVQAELTVEFASRSAILSSYICNLATLVR